MTEGRFEPYGVAERSGPGESAGERDEHAETLAPETSAHAETWAKAETRADAETLAEAETLADDEAWDNSEAWDDDEAWDDGEARASPQAYDRLELGLMQAPDPGPQFARFRAALADRAPGTLGEAALLPRADAADASWLGAIRSLRCSSALWLIGAASAGVLAGLVTTNFVALAVDPAASTVLADRLGLPWGSARPALSAPAPTALASLAETPAPTARAGLAEAPVSRSLVNLAEPPPPPAQAGPGVALATPAAGLTPDRPAGRASMPTETAGSVPPAARLAVADAAPAFVPDALPAAAQRPAMALQLAALIEPAPGLPAASPRQAAAEPTPIATVETETDRPVAAPPTAPPPAAARAAQPTPRPLLESMLSLPVAFQSAAPVAFQSAAPVMFQSAAPVVSQGAAPAAFQVAAQVEPASGLPAVAARAQEALPTQAATGDTPTAAPAAAPPPVSQAAAEPLPQPAPEPPLEATPEPMTPLPAAFQIAAPVAPAPDLPAAAPSERVVTPPRAATVEVAAPARTPQPAPARPAPPVTLAAATKAVDQEQPAPSPPRAGPSVILSATPSAGWSAADGEYRVQIAMLRDERNVKYVWHDFDRQLGPSANDLERYVFPAKTARGLFHMVQVGPFGDAGHAAALCNELKEHGGECVVVRRPS